MYPLVHLMAAVAVGDASPLRQADATARSVSHTRPVSPNNSERVLSPRTETHEEKQARVQLPPGGMLNLCLARLRVLQAERNKLHVHLFAGLSLQRPVTCTFADKACKVVGKR
jgi:hypothetical protein